MPSSSFAHASHSSAPLALRGFLPAWDVERRRADLSPIVDWVRARLRGRGVTVDELAELHAHLNEREAQEAAEALTEASVEVSFRRTLHQIVRDLLPELPFARLWVQTYAHFRILLPGCQLTPVPPHTDYGLGHDLSERNLWFALTDAAGSASLQLAPLRASLNWATRVGRVRDVGTEAPPLQPTPVTRGEVLLFSPLHLHGALPPAAATRVSLDVRLRPALRGLTDLTFSPLLEGS